MTSLKPSEAIYSRLLHVYRTFNSSRNLAKYQKGVEPDNLVTTRNAEEYSKVVAITNELQFSHWSIKDGSCYVSYVPSDKAKEPYESSWLQVRYPFREYPVLREMYRRPDDPSKIRWGRLMEALDAIAGDSAYRYCDPSGFHPNSPYSIVTACIDGMSFTSTPISHDDVQLNVDASLSIDKDLVLRSYVSHVGNTSMEIRTEIFQEDNCIGSGFLKMVVLNRDTGRPTQVPARSISSDTSPVTFPHFVGSDMIFGDAADSRNAYRKFISKYSLARQPPQPEETGILHQLWHDTLRKRNTVATLGGMVVTSGSTLEDAHPWKWMEHTMVTSTQLMQPNHRNVYGKIFGGYVARKAFETSWICAHLFTETPPVLIGVDNIFFLVPVEVGDIIEFTARVIFTTDEEIQVQVDALKIDPKSGKRQSSNSINIYYAAAEGNPVRVVPQTYEEFMLYLEGRRRYLSRRSKTVEHPPSKL